MSDPLLTAFWIVSPVRHAPLGFGVTAHSLNEAIGIIRNEGYAAYLPDDLGTLKITAGVSIFDLDENHVRPNMGPIVVRGMWYPFHRIGTN